MMNSGATVTGTHLELVRELGLRLDEAVGAALGGSRRVVLVDYPLHSNAGDAAIYLGEREWLRANGCELAHVCSLSTYDRDVLRRELGSDGVLLIHGGGNFGDLWPRFHALRERVAMDFPDRAIVQLPQTVYFSGEAAAERAASGALARHEALKILVRDQRSETVVRSLFPLAETQVAPDMAFALGPQPDRPPSVDVLWLSRTDLEREGERPTAGAGVEVTDWHLPPLGQAAWRAAALFPRGVPVARRWPTAHGLLARGAARTFDPLAWASVRSALRLLSRGRVVVSDRLHAHILGLLLGRPQVLLDNSYGKLADFRALWTAPAAGVLTAGSVEEARRTALAMAAAGEERPGA